MGKTHQDKSFQLAQHTIMLQFDHPNHILTQRQDHQVHFTHPSYRHTKHLWAPLTCSSKSLLQVLPPTSTSEIGDSTKKERTRQLDQTSLELGRNIWRPLWGWEKFSYDRKMVATRIGDPNSSMCSTRAETSSIHEIQEQMEQFWKKIEADLEASKQQHEADMRRLRVENTNLRV